METTEYKPTYEQLEAALTIAQYAIKRVYKPTAELQSLSIDLAQIDKVLAPPPPTYKEVTVERWECDECGSIDKNQPEGVCGTWFTAQAPCDSTSFTVLTGTRRVPVKQPVRKRVSIPAVIGDGKGLGTIGEMFGTVKRYSALEGHPECHGKTGTLTFEWEE